MLLQYILHDQRTNVHAICWPDHNLLDIKNLFCSSSSILKIYIIMWAVNSFFIKYLILIKIILYLIQLFIYNKYTKFQIDDAVFIYNGNSVYNNSKP